eukprot:424031-Hanusia_phi.AAC.1
MSSRAKRKWQEDKEMRPREHSVVSWTLDEYLKAVEHEDLGADPEQVLPCWGSCRYMLEMTGAEVREELKKAIEGASDIAGIFTGNVGSSSPEVLNRLIATLICQDPMSDEEMRKSMPVSTFAARELALKAEVSVLKQLISQHGMRHSVLRGILFEKLFIKGLSDGELTTRRQIVGKRATS